VDRHGAEVGVDPERRAQGKQAGFGLEMAGGVVERRVAYRAEENGIGPLSRGAGRLGERLALPGYPGRAYWVFRHLKPESESLARGAENMERCRDHLRPDPVTRQDRDPELRHPSSRARSVLRRRS
jgi:hypothetical protein